MRTIVIVIVRDFLSVCHCAQAIKIIPLVFGDSKGIYLMYNVPLRLRSLTVFNMAKSMKCTSRYLRGLGRLWRSEDVFSPAPLRLNVEIYIFSVSFIAWLSCPANLNEKPEIAVARKLCLLTAREFAR